MIRTFKASLKRDLNICMKNKSDIVQTLFFFAVILTLAPLALGSDAKILRPLAPGLVWVAALLASLLSLPRLFNQDYENGSLEQMALCETPLVLLILGKIGAHWISTGLPITLFSLVFSLMYDLPAEAATVLFLSLLLGTPILSLVGAIGAALTLGLRSSALLMGLLILPLYAPVLIFGAGATVNVLSGMSGLAQLMIVAALTLIGLATAPFAAAGAIRIALDV